MKITTYLNFGGNCAEALHFYEQHLGGKIVTMSTNGQMPGAKNLTPEQAKSIMHARIMIGDTLIMASDAPKDRYQPMRSVYLALSVDSNEEAERLYSTLTEGGEIFMKMEETFFAHRFAMFRDKFGTSWMIIHEKPMPRGA
jgi:PhnB protein